MLVAVKVLEKVAVPVLVAVDDVTASENVAVTA